MTGTILFTRVLNLRAVISIGCLVIQGVPLGQAPAPPPLPIVVEAEEPIYPVLARSALISGAVELNVVTDGKRAVKVDIVTPNPFLDVAAQKSVASWVFAPHQPTSFRTTIQFELHRVEFVDPLSCVTRAEPEVVTHELPTRLHVIGHTDVICDNVEPVKKVITASALAGEVVCDCPGRSPIPGASVSYYREPSRAERRRPSYTTEAQGFVEADANGRFRIEKVPAGTYSIQVGSLAFNARGYEVKVVSDGKQRAPVTLAIVPNQAVAEYLRLHPRETTSVGRPKQIPTYPLEALKAGIAGTAVIRVRPGSAPIAVSGPEPLASASLDSAKTWQTSSARNESFDVKIIYRLVDGDCTGGGPRVVIDLPHQIEITAKRLVPCGPNVSREP